MSGPAAAFPCIRAGSQENEETSMNRSKRTPNRPAPPFRVPGLSQQRKSLRLRWQRPLISQQQPDHWQAERLAGRSRRQATCAASTATGQTAKEEKTDRERLTALVEAAMLASVTGLAYHLSTSFRLEAYFGALLPFPTVLCGARHGAAFAGKTLVTSVLLLLVVGGPQRAAMYGLLHGSVGFAIAALWAIRAPWAVSLPLTTLLRTFSVFASLFLSSVLLHENVLAVVITQVHALLDQLSLTVGLAGAVSVQWVWWLAVVLVVVNSASYCFLLHVLYATVLCGMEPMIKPGFGNTPKFIQAILPQRQPGAL